MTVQTELVRGLSELRIVLGAMNIVTGCAGHTVAIHHTLDEVVALHPVLMSCAICEVKEVCLSKSNVFELPVIRQTQSNVIANGPVIGFAFDKARPRASLGVALDAGIV